MRIVTAPNLNYTMATKAYNYSNVESMHLQLAY